MLLTPLQSTASDKRLAFMPEEAPCSLLRLAWFGQDRECFTWRLMWTPHAGTAIEQLAEQLRAAFLCGSRASETVRAV